MGGISGLLNSVFGDPNAPIRAGQIQLEGTREGIEETRRQFDITQENLAPFREAEVGALKQQQALLGLGGKDEQTAAFEAFGDSPGQAFIKKRAQRALLRNQSAIGGLGGGNVRTALQEQGTQFAAQDLGNQFNRLAGIGKGATTELADRGAQSTQQVSNLINQGAQAQAGGILGANQVRANRGSLLLGAGAGLAAGLL